jgi:hypothetical protein
MPAPRRSITRPVPASTDPWTGQYRQVHLDFHNSPYITDLAADFDAPALARRFKAAHVNSVIVFAKCVHGMGYYPSKIVEPHPALRGRDLTGEMIEALHAEGIRAPIYTIIGWEENLAQKHPEWMQLCADGSFAQNAAASDGFSREPGRYRWLNFNHPDYQDYYEAHLREVLGRYECDGLFIDMLVVHPDADWSDHAIAFREKHGLMARDRLTHARYETAAQLAFASRFTSLIRKEAPGTAIFYNSENRLYSRSDLGVLARADLQTHFEIESLPSGMWNYHHFPRVARNLRSRAPWLGMTGRFQKMWGDFGGIKPAPALEFECFRTQAMGGANSVGDQLHPRGTLDEGAYELIGGVFAQCEIAEPFYHEARPCPQVAIVCPHDPESDEQRSTLVEEGLVALCQENHYDCALVNDADDLSAFDLLLLGEHTRVSEELRRKVVDFEKAGGKVIAAASAPFDADGKGWGIFQSLESVGEAAFAPAYWRARAESPIASVLGRDDRVLYDRGLRLRCLGEVQVWADRVAPYFQRSDLRFCSHFQAPPRPAVSGEPAIVAGDRWVVFADPIFSEYRKCANLAVARAFRVAVEHLIGPPRFGHGLKSTVRLYPLRAGNDLHLTLLHYLPERRALHADIISERLGFGGQILQLPDPIRTVRVFGSDEALARTPDGGFVLPMTEGRLLLEVPGFFTAEGIVNEPRSIS